MSSQNEMHILKLQQWAKLIQAANESPLQRSDWCRENGISESSFYYWQRRVRKHALDSMMASSLHEQSALPMQEKESAPDFYEITPHVSSEVSEIKEITPPPDTETGIIIHSGRFDIEIREHFSNTALASVLEVLSHV